MKQFPGYPENKPQLVVHYLSGKYKKSDSSKIFQDFASPSMIAKASASTEKHYDNSAKDIQIAVNDVADVVTADNQMNLLSIMLKKLQLCFDVHMSAMNEGS